MQELDFNDTDVVILAGGLGTRLRSRFPGLPKVLLPVNGRPLLVHLLDRLRAFGASRVHLALGHLSERVETCLREDLREAYEGALDVRTIVEPEPLGTGGALRFALPWLDAERVLVLNGDTYAPIDLGRLCASHVERGAEVSIALAHPLDGEDRRYGTVEVDGAGRVSAFREKEETISPGLVSAGVYAIERSVIESIPRACPVSLERDVFPRLVGGRIYAVEETSPFIDLGTPESYELAETFFSEVAR